ncbi:MAG: enoyl-CoA hydratase-related protein [Burkholderiales bacterium]
MRNTVLYAVADGIATITFNRPQVMNALDPEAIIEFRALCERAEHDTQARVVVLRGAGSAFLAGGDVASFKNNLADFSGKVIALAGELHRGILALRRAPKPVIASVHGAVAGAGMSIMMACDLIVAAEGTQFSMAYSRIATSPDGGATWFLPRLVGYQKAMELLLLADTVDAATLQSLGVINRVVAAAELEAATTTLAQRLAAGPATAYAETKALVNSSQKQILMTHLDAEAQAFARCSAHADFAEGVTAFVEKRKAVFKRD